ncbi:creatininase family protein [Kineosporia succinea]
MSGPAVATELTASSIIVLPTGAIEHHGAHLPLNTDALIAGSVAEAAVVQGRSHGLDLWLLPTLTYTKSDEHAWAPGTMWLSAETLWATLVDLGRSIAATPARTVVFVNGHGGNTALLGVALRELRRRYGLATFSMPAGVQRAGRGAEGEPDERGLGIHAGFGETSLVMHLRPDLVDLGLAERNVPDFVAESEYIGFNGYPVSFGWTSDDFGSGVIGDPTGANAQAGADLLAESVRRGVGALTEIAGFSPLLRSGEAAVTPAQS